MLSYVSSILVPNDSVCLIKCLVLGLLYLANPLILPLFCSFTSWKMLSHFHCCLSHSLLHVCIRTPETERLMYRPDTISRVCFQWLQRCFRARCDVVARSFPHWSAAMLGMLDVHLYCLVKRSSLISFGSHP